MASRVNGTEVKEIIDVELTVDQCEPFITAANLFVTGYLSDKGLSTALLKEIERWMAAHFICKFDPREQVVRIDTIEVNLEGTTGMGLMSTGYGQQAVILDTSGTLAAVAKMRPKATFSVLGEDDANS